MCRPSNHVAGMIKKLSQESEGDKRLCLQKDCERYAVKGRLNV